MLPGKGVYSVVEGQEILAGNTELFAENRITFPDSCKIQAEEFLKKGCTVIYIAVDGKRKALPRCPTRSERTRRIPYRKLKV